MKKLRKGIKDDKSKPDLSLIPKEALFGMAEAFTFGAKKYNKHNYRKGLEYSALVAATMRHLALWADGETYDKESGLSHISHCLSNLAMLKWMEENMPEMDDRWTPEGENE